MQKKHIVNLALITLLGFPCLGYIIHFFFTESDFLYIFVSKSNLLYETFAGLIVGIISGTIGWKIISLKFMAPVLNKYIGLISSIDIDLSLFIFISFCAGVGEEILFRGVLQPLIGIWITAVLFVAIHGYLNPVNWRISIYGIYLTLVIGIIGHLTDWLGLTTAIIAHMIIDVILFYKINQKFQTKIKRELKP